MMTLPTSPHNIRLWFLFDELGALHRLPAIEKGMQTARNFGGAFLLGVHTISKLRETYGEKIADTLASLARTKIILATPDYASAQWCSQQIGSSEWQQMEQGLSYGYANVRDAVTLTNKRQTEPLVMPDQIMKMRDLEGWLVFPQDMPAGKITLSFKARKNRATPFIPRPSTDIVPPDGDKPRPPSPASEPAAARPKPMFLPAACAASGNAEAGGGTGAADAAGAGAGHGEAGSGNRTTADDGAAGENHKPGNPDAGGNMQSEITAKLNRAADNALNAAVLNAGLVGPPASAPATAAPSDRALAPAEQPPAKVGMKLARVTVAKAAAPAQSEVPHDPETGEILPEKAIRTEGVELNIVAGPAPPKAPEQTEDLTVSEARQNFSRVKDLGLDL
jgi:hypothetical protein